jgi:UDP-4-amino-4,6-dideoxy-N-acetyl-beta-L-altrosamine N-acetyltransferase
MLKRAYCRFRSLQEEDLPLVLQWRNSERIRANMYSDHLISLQEHKAWFEKINRDKSVICKIFEYEGIPLGVVNFTQFDKSSNRCSWGFYIGEEMAPKGSGMAMGYLALQHIFEEVNIYKLCAEVLTFNEKSLRYHKKLGFSEEGRFVNHVYKNEQYHDVIPFAHFFERWLLIKAELEERCFE